VGGTGNPGEYGTQCAKFLQQPRLITYRTVFSTKGARRSNRVKAIRIECTSGIETSHQQISEEIGCPYGKSIVHVVLTPEFITQRRQMLVDNATVNINHF